MFFDNAKFRVPHTKDRTDTTTQVILQELADLRAIAVRTETRLCKLAIHLGLNTNEQPTRKPTN